MRSLVLGAALAAAAAAQPYGTDVICTTTGQVVYRLNAAGMVTTIVGSTGGQFANMVAMDNDNRNLAVLLFSPPSIVIVDPMLGSVVGTVWTGAPIFTADYFNPLHTGDFFVAGTAVGNLKALFVVRRDGSGATAFATGPPFAGLQGAIQDLATGRIAAGDITAQCVFDVDLNGTIVNTWVPGLVGPFAMTQDHKSGDLILGQGGNSARGVYRFSHATNAVTTIAPASVVGNSNAICFDRAPGSGEIVVGTGPVRRIDMMGNVLASHSPVPATNSGMCFYQERNVVSVRVAQPNQWRFDLSFPGEAGNNYVLALSSTGFTPGIPVDARFIQLVPDLITLLSVSGGLFPLLQGNVGTLDANDRGTATLDLSAFGPLTGFQLWAVAITLHPGAPSGINTIARPIIVVLD